MKLQNLTVIFIIIILPVILLTSFYISTGLKTIRYQALYDTGLITATQDAIQAFEINTLNNKYSDNAETKRSIIKSSVKMLETSLCNNCNISSYNRKEIEEYIPAIMFGMYDGFYLYAPSYNPTSEKYEHSLKNYVYYSETLNKDKGIIIRYYLDSYVHVSGYINNVYQSDEGYLINVDKTEFYNSGGSVSISEFNRNNGKITYYGYEIDMKDELAVNYFIDNYKFSKWFNENIIINIDTSKYSHLIIDSSNDPEDPNSAFAQYRNKIIKNKVEGVLNSTITAYSQRTWNQEYKMPKLSEEDWEKIYSDISVTAFFQGKKIGFTKYNGYCVLNSNNHYELINPNLLYFSTDDDNNNIINTSTDYYHDIRCTSIANKDSIAIDIEGASKQITTLRGWRIGRFQKLNVQDDALTYDSASTELTTQPTYNKYSIYMYERAECACYECINGTTGATSIYDYIKVADTGGTAEDFIKRSYWTSLARERAKYRLNKEIDSKLEIVKSVDESTVINGSDVTYTIRVTNKAEKKDYITIYDIFVDNELELKNEPNNPTYKKYDKNGNVTSSPVYGYSGPTNGIITWNDIEILPSETIEIKYKAKVNESNIDSDNIVRNVVQVIADGSIQDEDEAICNTIDSDLTVTKTIKQGANTVSSVEYESEVEYEIKITNNNTDTSLKDKIHIIDAFNDGQITLSSNITTTSTKDGITTIRNLGETEVKTEEEGYDITIGITSVTDRMRIWKDDIEIEAGETITISYKAILRADIGETITNIAMAKSIYTGDTQWKQQEANCMIEKKINIDKEPDKGYNIVLVLDHSFSMFTGDKSRIKNLYKAVSNFTGKFLEEKNATIASNTVISTIHFGNNASEEYRKFGIEGIREIKNFYGRADYDSSILNNFGEGTNYNDALDKANSVIDTLKVNYPNNNNMVVFFTDGEPTHSALITQGCSLCSGDNANNARYDVATWVFGLISISRNSKAEATWAKEIWFNDSNSIVSETNALRTKGVKLYCVYHEANDTSTYGLKKYLTTSQNTGNNNEFFEGDIATGFESIINATLTQVNTEPKTSTLGKISNIEQVDKISRIAIGSTNLTTDELTIIKNLITNSSDKATLNLGYVPPEGTENRDAIIAVLNKFKTGDTITIYY